MEKSSAQIQSERLLVELRNVLISDIVDYLKNYTSLLDNNYSWKSKFQGVEEFIDKAEFERFDKIEDAFAKTDLLKSILSGKLLYYYQNDKIKFDELSLWIIQKWGRISKGEPEKILQLIHEFVVTKGSSNFDRISSKSKVLGFMYPQDFIIYDSRIAYAMNMILLIRSTTASVQRYFPIPDSLNKTLKELNLHSLVLYLHTRKYIKVDKKEVERRYFIDKEDAYIELNNLIKDINKKLWDNDRKNEPFYTQMLLFTLADTIIFEDLKVSYKEIFNDKGN